MMRYYYETYSDKRKFDICKSNKYEKFIMLGFTFITLIKYLSRNINAM